MQTAPLSPTPVSDLASVATVLLAGGKGARLHELTASESKPAIFFAGERRIIDFAMANVVHSGLSRLLVATQFAPRTLHAHLPRRWGGSFAPGALAIEDGRDTYLGTLDAVRRNWRTVETWGGDTVLVLAADHIYEMDYGALIRAHRASGAEVTVAVDVVPQKDASGFGVMHADGDGLITAFLEKPSHPPAIVGEPGRSMASMGVYVFSKSWLRQAMTANASATDFGHHLIPQAVDERVAMAYRLPPSAMTGKVYWRDVGTLDALRLAHLDFAGSPPCRLPGHATAAQWRAGCDSILMPGASMARRVRIARTIVAPGTHLPAGLVVGDDPLEDRRWFRRTDSGTVLVTQPMIDRRAELRPRPSFISLRGASQPGLAALNSALDNSNA